MASEQKAESTIEKKSKWALPIVFFTVFIDLLGFSIVLPILAPLLVLPQGSDILPNMDFNQRLIVFGFLVASYALAQFIATPIIGQLSDRFGRKPLLGISLFGTLVARLMFIHGIVTLNITTLFLSRIIDGITGGNISVAQSSIADMSTPQNRAKNFGLLGAAFGLGFIIGPYVGGKLGEAAIVSFFSKLLPFMTITNSTLPLWFATVLCTLNVIFLVAAFPETIKEKIKKALNPAVAVTNVVKAFRMPALRVTFITVFFLTLGFSFFTQFFTVYIGNKFQSEIATDVKTYVIEDKITFDIPKNAVDGYIAQIKVTTGVQLSQEDAQSQLKARFVEFVKTVDTNNLPDVNNISYPKEISSIPIESMRTEAQNAYKQSYLAFNGLVAAETQKRSADVFSYVGLWSVIAQAFLARQLAKRFKSHQLLKIGLIINALATLLFLMPDKIGWLFIIIPIFALSNGLIQPNTSAIVSNSADKKSQGEVLGINSSIQALGQALPPIISGYVAGSITLGAPILIGCGLIFLAFLVFAVFYRENKEVLHEE